MTDLFSKHKVMIANLANLYFPNPADAEDAMQEAYIKFVDVEIFGVDNEAGLVRVIAANFFKDLYSKERRLRELDQQAAILEDIDESDPLMLALLLEEDTECDRTLEVMPLDLSATAKLYYINGLSYRQIAAQLDIPEGTVASRLYKVRQYFQGETV